MGEVSRGPLCTPSRAVRGPVGTSHSVREPCLIPRDPSAADVGFSRQWTALRDRRARERLHRLALPLACLFNLGEWPDRPARQGSHRENGGDENMPPTRAKITDT